MARRARGGWKPRKDPASWAKQLQRKERKLTALLGRSLTSLTKDVADTAKEKAIVTKKRINKQDAPGGKARPRPGRSPIRSSVQKKNLVGIVRCQSFWTPARTRVIRALYAKYGLGQQLLRRWLYILKRPIGQFKKRGRPGARESIAGPAQLVKVNLARDPNLRRWAINTKQAWRHVLFLSDPRVRRDMVLASALNKNRSSIYSAARTAIKTAFK